VDERHLSFESWEGLSRVLTTKRLELLRHLRRHPAASVAALARAIGRDYKRVHEDVEALAESGLLTRDERSLRTGYDEIRATIAV
jgi:predicted transcriptional regulator